MKWNEMKWNEMKMKLNLMKWKKIKVKLCYANWIYVQFSWVEVPPAPIDSIRQEVDDSGRLSMSRLSFVRDSRTVETCQWCPAGCDSGLGIQHGRQGLSLCGRLCACTREILGRCRVVISVRKRGYEGPRGNDVMTTCLVSVSVWRENKKNKIR